MIIGCVGAKVTSDVGLGTFHRRTYGGPLHDEHTLQKQLNLSFQDNSI
jgi:hypothetical protein